MREYTHRAPLIKGTLHYQVMSMGGSRNAGTLLILEPLASMTVSAAGALSFGMEADGHLSEVFAVVQE